MDDVNGRVTSISDARGLGTITADDGTTYLFHVIEIADGTRTIDHDQAVEFEPLCRFGRIQASRIRKV